MKIKKKKLTVLNMCDFCIYEIKTCKAQPVFGEKIENGTTKLSKKNAVIACDKYESPMRTIETQHY